MEQEHEGVRETNGVTKLVEIYFIKDEKQSTRTMAIKNKSIKGSVHFSKTSFFSDLKFLGTQRAPAWEFKCPRKTGDG